MAAAAQVKKSIYLDADLDGLLKASAAASGRSVTRELNFLLRERLTGTNAFLQSSSIANVAGGAWRGPDPKVKKRP